MTYYINVIYLETEDTRSTLQLKRELLPFIHSKEKSK